MKEQQRSILVGLFVLAALAALGWMIFKFRDLPVFMTRYDTNKIHIYFTDAPEVQKDTTVSFCGYSVGQVIDVAPPQPLSDVEDPQRIYYQIVVTAAVPTDQPIPQNVVPMVYQRGLGGCFIELTLAGPASATLLSDGAKIRGYVSEASEFISEKTQRQLDELIVSLTRLSDTMKTQLESLPPQQVDRADSNDVQANITTVVMRMDEALRNLNIYLDDPHNQRHFKQGLADFAMLSSEMLQVVRDANDMVAKSERFIEQITVTAANMNELTDRANASVQQVTAAIQSAADDLAVTFKHLNEIARQIADGQGAAGRVLKDPRLYEALVDTTENLNQAADELRELIQQWSEEGVRLKHW